MAVLSASFLCAGVLRHYWDIYKERTVRGISFIFVGIDAGGDLFSLISVCESILLTIGGRSCLLSLEPEVFQPKLDILGMVIYGSELTLWIGVFACGGYFNFTPWVRKRLDRSRSPRRQQELALEAPSGSHSVASGRDEYIGHHSAPSSTSVFRTPSSLIMHSESSSLHAQDR